MSATHSQCIFLFFGSYAGVAGELVIAGECLARGYMNRPDVTATKFRPIPDPNDLHNARAPAPTHSLAGPRAYFTGDLCRYAPDGTIVYLGRIDSQVTKTAYSFLSTLYGRRQSSINSRLDGNCVLSDCVL